MADDFANKTSIINQLFFKLEKNTLASVVFWMISPNEDNKRPVCQIVQFLQLSFYPKVHFGLLKLKEVFCVFFSGRWHVPANQTKDV